MVVAGQPLILQLNSSAVSFSTLAGNSTGWRIQQIQPDGSAADLGLMADWTSGPDDTYAWNMTVPGSLLTLVGFKEVADGVHEPVVMFACRMCFKQGAALDDAMRKQLASRAVLSWASLCCSLR
jgi:hypothetical protein